MTTHAQQCPPCDAKDAQEAQEAQVGPEVVQGSAPADAATPTVAELDAATPALAKVDDATPAVAEVEAATPAATPAVPTVSKHKRLAMDFTDKVMLNGDVFDSEKIG